MPIFYIIEIITQACYSSLICENVLPPNLHKVLDYYQFSAHGNFLRAGSRMAANPQCQLRKKNPHPSSSSRMVPGTGEVHSNFCVCPNVREGIFNNNKNLLRKKLEFSYIRLLIKAY